MKYLILFLSLVFLFFSVGLLSERTRYLLELPACFRIGGPWHHYFEPGCRGETSATKIPYSINEDSLRERPRGALGKGGVLLLGDSLVEGKGLRFEHTLGQRLESLFSGTKFINGGIHGRGTVLESLAMEEMVKRYQPAKVIWFISETDISDDKLAYALKASVDRNGVPLSLGTEDFQASTRIHKWRERIGRLGGIMDLAVYTAYRWKVEKLISGVGPEFNVCGGIQRGLEFLRKRKIPVQLVYFSLGPNGDQVDMDPIVSCGSGVSVVDLRREVDAKGESIFLPGDVHLNPGGTTWLAERMRDPIRNLRK